MHNSTAGLTRLLLFLAVGVLHLVFILFFAFQVNTAIAVPEQRAAVMKLADILEEEPPPPPPPPPQAPPPVENAVESIAETMIETEEEPDQVVVPPLAITAPPVQQVAPRSGENYLRQDQISLLPVFSERDLRRDMVYPSIALRSGLEGIVYLELFVDRQGMVQRITVLKEDPPDRGFAEAAVKLFTGRQGKPAEANGEAVAVRYRYPVRFSIR